MADKGAEVFVLRQLRKVLKHGWGEVRVVVTDHAVQRADVATQHKPGAGDGGQK